MKIRMHTQSIRLRLSQHDVSNLKENSSVSVPLFVGMHEDDLYIYKLSLIDEGKSEVKLQQDQLHILILKSELHNWLMHDDVVSFECTLETISAPLLLLIERDFKCVTPRKENEEDLFENPNTKC